MARGVSETLSTELPARFDRFFPWADMDRRSSVAREFAADLNELWQDLGGVDHLSVQKRWLVERAVFLRRRMVEFETAVMDSKELPMTYGEYSNLANVCVGHLKTLGIDRKARPVDGLSAWMASKDATQDTGA